MKKKMEIDKNRKIGYTLLLISPQSKLRTNDVVPVSS